MKKILTKYNDIIMYLVFGGLTTIISLSTYYLLVFTLLDPFDAFQLQLANIISWIVGVTFAYITNRKYVFKSKDVRKVQESMKFLSARIITLLLDMLIMFIFVTVFHFDNKIIKIISQIIIIVSNYLFSRLFVFKKH